MWDTVPGGVVLYEPIGPVVYLGAAKHAERLKKVLKMKLATVVVSLELVTRVDVDGAEELKKVIDLIKKKEVQAQMVVPEHLMRGCLGKVAWLKALGEDSVHGELGAARVSCFQGAP